MVQEADFRQVVTIVTSDLKGSTSLGERLDPETLREVLGRYFDEMRLVLESHGGTIEKIIGDAIVAVFGLPVARDDDAVRAVVAAAETQRSLATLNEALSRTWGVTLTTRTGVATGEVVVGEASTGQHVLTGPALGLATAMEQSAPAMEVLVHESTYRLVHDHVEVEMVEPFMAKGIDEPLIACRLVAVRASAGEAIAAWHAAVSPESRTGPSRADESPSPAPSSDASGAAFTSPAPFQESRKTVTIVFADPKPTTADGNRPTPEALRDVMSSYFGEMRQILERHGGTVEKFIGDAVMAVFGLPNRHEDDALRATRAASDMQAALPAFNAMSMRAWGVELRTHIGVNTGEVVAGDASLGQRLVTGDAVNVAARLEQAAGAGSVLLGDLTYRLIRDAVEVEAVEPLTLKGKAEPVPAHRLVTITTGSASGRRQDAPMVGRDEEFAVLTTALSEATNDQIARSITVIGDAGVGKTRLVREFLGVAAAQGTILQGRCLPYGDGITFWPLIDVVRGASAIDDGDSPETAMLKLQAAVGGDDDVADRVASVMGLSTTSYQVAELFWGIRRFFELSAGGRPVVILFDDIHWAEQTFLDLVEHLTSATQDTALLLLCTARHELLETHPNWGEQPGAARIVLGPLSDADAAAVVGNLLGQTGLAASAQARIVSASEGNPLFVEQLLSMLIDNGRLKLGEHGWTATSDLSDLSIPPTIHALLAARLDSLPRHEREIVEPASVIGLIFPQDALEALVSAVVRDVIPEHLGELTRRQLLHRQTDTEPDATFYRFHHLLIRDAAYQGLLKRSRANLHERFVAWADVANAASGREIEFEEILGYHLEQAYRYRSELGPLDEHGVALGSRAAERLGSAGRRAIGRGDMPAAASLLGRAAIVLASDDPTRPSLLIATGEARLELGEFAEAATLFDRAMEAAAGLGDPSLEATARIERLRLRYMTDAAGSDAQISSQVHELIPLLEGPGAAAGLARAWRLLTYVEAAAAQWGAAEQAATAMLAHAQVSGDRLMEIRGLPALAGIARYGPRPVTEALRDCEDLLARAEGDRRAEALIQRAIAHLIAMQGDFATARDIYQRVRHTLQELGWNFDAALISIDSGPIEMMAGDYIAAESELRADYEALDRIGERNYIATTAAYLADALYRQGRTDESIEFVTFSSDVAAADDLLTQILWRAVRAKLLAVDARADEATELAREAVRLAHTSDDLTLQGNALADLAEVLTLTDRSPEAGVALEAAILRFESKGNNASADRASARLNAIRGGSATHA